MGVKRSRSDTVSVAEDPNSPTVINPAADVKIVHLDADSGFAANTAVMKCSLPPHQPLEFTSFEDYDVHYQKMHMHRCTECKKNFPDEHFLHLHIAENHDPIRAAMKDKGEKTYACLLPTCDRLCSTPHKRRLHCIDKHSFPKNFDFYIVNDGIDRRNSMLRPPQRRRSSTLTSLTSSGGNENGNRGRSNTMGSTAEAHGGDAGAEEMDIVHDDEEKEGEMGGDDQKSEKLDQRTPVKLRGRGGFGHGRGVRSWGRGGRGRGDPSEYNQHQSA